MVCKSPFVGQKPGFAKSLCDIFHWSRDHFENLLGRPWIFDQETVPRHCCFVAEQQERAFAGRKGGTGLGAGKEYD